MDNSEDNKNLPLTLRKSSKLRHRSLVESLFAKGKGIYEFPLRGVWRALDSRSLDETFKGQRPERIGLVQLLITVPKKKRRHATDRVLVRRRIRESFRLRRREFESRLSAAHPEIRTLSLAFLYQSTENLDFANIDCAVGRILSKIERKLVSPTAPPQDGKE